MPKLEPRVLCAPSPLLTQLKVLAHDRAPYTPGQIPLLTSKLDAPVCLVFSALYLFRYMAIPPSTEITWPVI